MGGPVTVMQPRGDSDIFGRDAPGEGRAPPSFGEVWSASRETQAVRNTNWQDIVYDEEFGPVLTEINRRRQARGEAALLPPSMGRAPNNRQRRSYGMGDAYGLSQTGRVTREEAAQGILGEVARERGLDPKAFPGVAPDLDGFMAPRWAKEKPKNDKAGAVLDRSKGVSSLGVSLLGGAGKAFEDPFYVITLPFGGAGRTFAMRLLIEVGANMGIEALQLPQAQRNLDQLGAKMTAGEALLDVASAGVGGGVFRGLVEGGGVVGRAAIERGQRAMPKDWQLAQQLKREVPMQLRMPEQQAAIHVVERGAEIDASSPWRSTHQALDAHGERLQMQMDALQKGEPMEAPPVAAAKPAAKPAVAKPRGPAAGPTGFSNPVYNGLKARGIPDHVARGAAAGVHAESRSDPNVRGGYKGRAVGIGQWLGPRREKLFNQYGPNPTMDQQLDFLAYELKGGDPGGAKVLASRDEVGALHSYINDFMRPAKGAETSGDLKRGMAALGRGGEDFGDSAASPVGAVSEPIAFPTRPAAMDAERPLVDGPDLDLDPALLNPALVGTVRTLAAERGGRSLNDIGAIADDLGVDEGLLRGAYDSLVGSGELRRLRDGSYRRVASPAANAGPEDMTRFLARRGGLSYDGFSAGQRQRNLTMDNPPRGHDLKNSGNIDAFVPGAGPLLRPNGMGLDEAGELLWEAGYFGPTATTPRPSETEIITLLDDVLRRGEKRYSFADGAPEAKLIKDGPDKAGWQSEAHYDAVRDQWRQSGERLLGRDLNESEFERALKALRDDPLNDAFERDVGGAGYDAGEHLDPYVARMVNREIDDALEDAFLEIEDRLYDFDTDAAAAATGQAGRAGQGGAGSAADAGDARSGAGSADAGAGLGRQEELSPAALDAAEAAGALGPPLFDPSAHKAFDDLDSPGAAQASASVWHDIRAEADPAALIDLDDGRGPRAVSEIEAELDADDAALAAIQACLT